MNRNVGYKKPSAKFADSKRAKASRVEEKHENRKTARLAKSNAKRGLIEVDQQQNALNLKEEAAEIPHEQKLQERLAKLKAWKEAKVKEEQKAKATKKPNFVVPGMARADNKMLQETLSVAKPAGRVTRSQTKKVGDGGKQWTVTPTIPVPKKASKPSKVQELKSFAPKNFTFSAPKEVVDKTLQLQDVIAEPSLQSLSLDTPQRSTKAMNGIAEEDDIKISPLLQNNPWITTTRGSSSTKRRMTMTALAANPIQDVQSSPYLKKRSDSLGNSAPVNREAMHFRSLMASEGSRLTDLCNYWDELLESNEVPEAETGSVRTVIGQAKLLQAQRFVQFGGLINQFEDKTGEKEITFTDLEGFWEMIYIQVSDVDKKFEALAKLRADGWINNEEMPGPMLKPKKKATGARPTQTRGAKSNIRAHIAAARKNQLAVKSPGSPSMRRSCLLMSPARTPAKRQSLRRSVLLSSAKKPVFIVTDIAPKTSVQQEFIESGSDVERGSPSDEQPTVILNATPNQKKTYGRTHQVVESVGPEERLSAAFEAVKSEPETSHKMSPLKVFQGPGDEESGEGSDAFALTPRRSSRLRNTKSVAPSPRFSLLPGATISPVPPQDNLMSFD